MFPHPFRQRRIERNSLPEYVKLHPSSDQYCSRGSQKTHRWLVASYSPLSSKLRLSWIPVPPPKLEFSVEPIRRVEPRTAVLTTSSNGSRFFSLQFPSSVSIVQVLSHSLQQKTKAIQFSKTFCNNIFLKTHTLRHHRREFRLWEAMRQKRGGSRNRLQTEFESF